MSIKFGTSGWRAVFAEDFTFENVRKLTHVISAHVKESLEFGFNSPDYGQAASSMSSLAPLVVVGYDFRFLSEAFARESGQVFAIHGSRVFFADAVSPIPADRKRVV